MEAYALDWVQLVIRWVHLITGIACGRAAGGSGDSPAW